MPSHYLNQCWVIVNWTLRNKLQWNLSRNTKVFIDKNAFKIVVCEMAAILSRGRWVNSLVTTECVFHFKCISIVIVVRCMAKDPNDDNLEFSCLCLCHWPVTYSMMLSDWTRRCEQSCHVVVMVSERSENKFLDPCHWIYSISGLGLDILKVESWTQMGRTANTIIKYSIHVFASICKNMRI